VFHSCFDIDDLQHKQSQQSNLFVNQILSTLKMFTVDISWSVTR
jgi:hypothetical protein